MDNLNLVELKSLVGKHVLSGVDEVNRKMEIYEGEFEDCQCINFVLDGITYTAIEDPSDGYRSALDSLIRSDDKVSNNFTPIEVTVSYVETSDEHSGVCDILEFRDTKNGKLVLEIGTDNVDDYYPVFVGSFIPENLSINEGKYYAGY